MCFHSAMKFGNGVSDMGLCLQIVKFYSYVKLVTLYIRASYIVFLFVKSKNINFIKEIKHFLCAFIVW